MVNGKKVDNSYDDVVKEIEKVIFNYLNEADRIAQILYHKNIQVILLKNGGIARGLFRCHGCCPMGDLDILIKRSDFNAAHKILLGEGYKLAFRNTLLSANMKTVEEESGGEYFKILPMGEKLWLELQWRAVSGRWLNQEQGIH